MTHSPGPEISGKGVQLLKEAAPRTLDELKAALVTAIREHADGFFLFPNFITGKHESLIPEFAATNQIPTTLKAGETCHIPAQQVHFGTTGSESVKFLSRQVRETGTPGVRVQANNRDRR